MEQSAEEKRAEVLKVIYSHLFHGQLACLADAVTKFTKCDAL